MVNSGGLKKLFLTIDPYALMNIKERLQKKKNRNALWVAVIAAGAIIIPAIISIYTSKSSSSNQEIEIKNNQNSPVARDIQTQNNYYISDSIKANLKGHKFEGDSIDQESKTFKSTSNNGAIRKPSTGEKILEISIQLESGQNGFNSITVNGKDANILPTSTPTNPRVSVRSNSNEMQTITIITKNGDTCILKRIFDKTDSNNFPIRFTPDCKNQKL